MTRGRLQHGFVKPPEILIGLPDGDVLPASSKSSQCWAVGEMMCVAEGADRNLMLDGCQLVGGKLHVRLGDGEVEDLPAASPFIGEGDAQLFAMNLQSSDSSH
ncbi:hypothetical protein D3C87_1915870 [compost metagenome]